MLRNIEYQFRMHVRLMFIAAANQKNTVQEYPSWKRLLNRHATRRRYRLTPDSEACLFPYDADVENENRFQLDSESDFSNSHTQSYIHTYMHVRNCKGNPWVRKRHERCQTEAKLGALRAVLGHDARVFPPRTKCVAPFFHSSCLCVCARWNSFAGNNKMLYPMSPLCVALCGSTSYLDVDVCGIIFDITSRQQQAGRQLDGLRFTHSWMKDTLTYEHAEMCHGSSTQTGIWCTQTLTHT